MLEAGGDIWGPRVDVQHHGGVSGAMEGGSSKCSWWILEFLGWKFGDLG